MRDDAFSKTLMRFFLAVPRLTRQFGTPHLATPHYTACDLYNPAASMLVSLGTKSEDGSPPLGRGQAVSRTNVARKHLSKHQVPL
jgi:hypothetical protein